VLRGMGLKILSKSMLTRQVSRLSNKIPISCQAKNSCERVIQTPQIIMNNLKISRPIKNRRHQLVCGTSVLKIHREYNNTTEQSLTHCLTHRLIN